MSRPEFIELCDQKDLFTCWAGDGHDLTIEEVEKMRDEITEAIKAFHERSRPPAPPDTYMDSNHEIIEQRDFSGPLPRGITMLCGITSPRYEDPKHHSLTVCGHELEMPVVHYLSEWLIEALEYYDYNGDSAERPEGQS